MQTLVDESATLSRFPWRVRVARLSSCRVAPASVCLSVVQPPPPPPHPITAAATILNYCRARLRLNHRQPELINCHSLSFSNVCVRFYSHLD